MDGWTDRRVRVRRAKQGVTDQKGSSQASWRTRVELFVSAVEKPLFTASQPLADDGSGT